MPNLMNFGQGIVLLIGILICAGGGLILSIVLYTTARIVIFHVRQRRSYAEYHRRTRRADGKMYPPVHPGFCDHCGRSSSTIYYLPTGEKLCRDCYEPYWRKAENWSDAPPPSEPIGTAILQRLAAILPRRTRDDS